MRKIATSISIFLMVISAFAAGTKRPEHPLSVSSNFAVVPSMANVPGLFGAVWKTKVELYNPTATAYSVQVTLYDNTGKLKEATIDLAAGQLRSYENFLSDVFSFGGAGAVKFDGGSDDNQFVLNAAVYTDTANGRYITPVPALIYDASSLQSYSLGITVDSSARTNIGAFNPSSSANVVTANLFDPSGSVVSTLTLTLAPQGWNQISIPTTVSGGYVEFKPTLPAYCYAVVVNNTSNDGNFVEATEFAP